MCSTLPILPNSTLQILPFSLLYFELLTLILVALKKHAKAILDERRRMAKEGYDYCKVINVMVQTFYVFLDLLLKSLNFHKIPELIDNNWSSKYDFNFSSREQVQKLKIVKISRLILAQVAEKMMIVAIKVP